MNKFLLTFCALASAVATNTYAADGEWAPAGDRIISTWGENLDPSNVLPEYPRPIMERESWMNLNGLWEYTVINKGDALPEGKADGRILVPFAIESSLSGVGQRLGETKELVYKRSFTVPADWKGKNVMLNFGAVDWKADVWVNGVKVGSHTGGFTPFSFDITEALVKKGEERREHPYRKGMGPYGQELPATREAGEQPGRHLVYPCKRHLADSLARACFRISLQRP